MTRNLDIATLRSLVAIADSGGVTRAANRLHLTQSAVSMQIKRLEESLGLDLLERNGRGVSTTLAGEQLLTFARKLVTLNDEAMDRMVAPRFEGSITVGFPCDLVYPAAPEILRRFNEDFPRVHIRLVSSFTTALLEDFRRGALDVILTTEDHPGDGAETIATSRLLWFGAIDGRAWLQRPLPFASARHCVFRAAAIRALDDAGIQWVNAVDTEQEGPSVAATSADLCVMALLENADEHRVAPIPHGGKLPDLPEILVNMYLARETESAELAAEFSAYVRAAFAG